ncbi:MAG TPA: hypothetical protein VFX51_24660 [Solirubrobacteraceae bacterium]|nr:hypothetical protein [Solirubrobacteraceae bacterium]
MQGGIGSRPAIFWMTAVSAVLMVVGGFGPWATALGVTISGTDGGDGWFLIIPGLLALGLLFVQVSRPSARWPMILVLLLGALGALVAGIDLNDINNLGGQDAFFDDAIDTGWALYLSLFASLALGCCAVSALVRRPYLAAATA